MEFRQLYTFIQVAQQESFSKAAENLGYSQSAVTVQIRSLEDELHTKLFTRMGKHIALTDQGRRFLSGAYNTIFEANQAKLSVQDRGQLLGSLHIGVLDSLCAASLPHILRRFRSEHPQVVIRITTGSPEELIRKMDQGLLDLIYILDDPRYNNSWHKEMEVREEIVFVASNDVARELQGKTPLCVSDLLDLPFFLTERESNYHRALRHFIASQDCDLSPMLEISNVSFIIRLLETSRGVSFLPWYAVEDSVRAGTLSVLDVADLHIRMYRQIFYHKATGKTREMDEFIRIAWEEVRRESRP